MIIAAIVAVVIGSALFTSYTVVEPGFTAVKITMGQPDLETAYKPGFYFIAPYGLGEMVQIETRENVYRSATIAASYDLQDITVEIMVNYKPIVNKVPALYNDLGMNYIQRIVDPAVQETMKQVTAEYTAPELIQKRPEVKAKVVETIRERLAGQPILITQISVTNLDFTAEYKSAIEEKETAIQLADKAENEIREHEAVALQVAADANGKALAIERVADAEAYALEVLGTALEKYPDLLTLKNIERWDGILPQFLINGDGESPTLLLSVPSDNTNP